MHNEIKDAIDRAAAAVRNVHKVPGSLSLSNDAAIKQTLLALVDVVVEIAAALPSPFTVPKEEDAEVDQEPPDEPPAA